MFAVCASENLKSTSHFDKDDGVCVCVCVCVSEKEICITSDRGATGLKSLHCLELRIFKKQLLR